MASRDGERKEQKRKEQEWLEQKRLEQKRLEQAVGQAVGASGKTWRAERAERCWFESPKQSTGIGWEGVKAR